jgi:hypothetical protein
LKALSEIIGFLILILILVAIVFPLLSYVLDNLSTNYNGEQYQPQILTSKFVNITYETNTKYSYSELVMSYLSYSAPPHLINVYNASSPVLTTMSYTQISSGPGQQKYEIFGYSPRIIVEIEYNGQVYFGYVTSDSFALVG